MRFIRQPLDLELEHDLGIPDPRVMIISELSDGAKVLYAWMSICNSGMLFDDKKVSAAFGITQQVLTKRKAELKKHKLILPDTDKKGRVYFLYIGNTQITAKAVKQQWMNDEGNVYE